MKPHLLLLLVLFLSVRALVAEDATEICFAGGEGWSFSVLPDGSVSGQYGSTPGDSIGLPPGSADFEALCKFVDEERTDEKVSGTQAAVRHKNEISITLKPLRDDSMIAELFARHRNKWRGGLGENPPSSRVSELMRKIRYYKSTERNCGVDGLASAAPD